MHRTATLLFIFFITPVLLLQAQAPELTIQLGHSKLVYDVAYSPDGRYAASASADRTVKIWELEEGREVLTLYIDEGYATSVQFSSDSRQLLVGGGSYDVGELKIYDLESGTVAVDFRGHEEYAWNAEFSVDGRYVFSASFDETVRMWDRSTGEELRSTPKLNGLMRQLSVDPRGEYIATTCDDTLGAALWSAEDLSLVRRLYVDDLFESRTIKFSGDGEYIIVGDWSRRVAVFSREGAWPEYVVDAHTGSSNIVRCVGADVQGRYFFSGSSDRLIHQFDVRTGEYLATFRGHADEVYALDIHPKGDRLLSGGSFDKSIREWDLATRSPIRTFGGTVFPVTDLALSGDGNHLYINSGDRFGGDVYAWRLDRMNSMVNLGNSELNYSFMDVNDDNILAASPDGKITIFQAGTNAVQNDLYLWQQIYDARFTPNSSGLAVGIAQQYSDGSSSNTYRFMERESGFLSDFNSGIRPTGSQDLEYSSDGSSYYILETNWNRVNRLSRYTDSSGALIAEYTDTNFFFPGYIPCPDDRHVMLVYNKNFHMIDMSSGEVAWRFESELRGDIQAISFIDSNMAVFSGGDWSAGFVAVMDLAERKVIRVRDDFNTGQGAVVYDKKRKLIISGGDDARITLMDAGDLTTQLTLFAFADTRGEWAAIHPSGLFDGSKEAIEKHMYFTYKLEPIKLFQLKQRYYEPGLVQKVLGYNEEPLRDVSRFNDVSLYPKAHLEIDDGELVIRLQERSGGVGRVSFLINGKEQLSNISSWFNKNLKGVGDGYNTARIKLENYSRFMVPGEANRLEVITANLEGNITSPAYHIEYVPPMPAGFGPANIRPSMHAIVVGTSDYRGTALDLNFAAKDAEDMADALFKGGTELFGADHIEIHLLNTDQEAPERQPTKENIAAKMLEIAQRARPEDVFLLYLSGHGVTYGEQNPQFHYLTEDIESGDISDPVIRGSYTISTSDMTEWLNAIPAKKQILILDACSSGQAVDDLLSLSKNVSSSQIKALDKMKDRTGLFIVAGSAANKVSFEASQFGQSLLTYSLLNGMNIVSSKSEDRMVDLVDWLNYSKEQVPELAGTIGGIQEPIVALPRNLNSFDIVRIDESSMIEVADIKPVFVRTTLMDMNEMDDGLGLSDQLDRYFQDLSAKGRTSEVIFVDVKSFPSAYSIKGFYETADGKVEVNATLRKGDEKIGLINVSGPVENPADVRDRIVEVLNEMIAD